MTKPDGDEADTAIRQILRAENRKKTIAEQKRLLYVAFTRAENHLIICQKIVADSKPKPIAKANCWSDWLRFILQRDEFSFIEDTIYSTAELSLEELTHKSDDSPDVEAVDFAPGLIYPEFIDPLKTAVTVARKMQSRQGINYMFAPEYWLSDEDKSQNLALSTKSYSGLHAAEISILVHRLLSQNIPADLNYYRSDQLAQRVRAEAVLEGWTPTRGNIQTVVKEILGAQKWINDQSLDPNRCYRNVEFEAETAGETILGSIDLLYYNIELAGWVIVDFKTDRIPSEDMIAMTITEREYERQMHYYCQAAETILGECIQERMLFFTKFERVYRLGKYEEKIT
jgi:ATP-dependent exoDNAse (exonuclease V) beta subunit